MLLHALSLGSHLEGLTYRIGVFAPESNLGSIVRDFCPESRTGTRIACAIPGSSVPCRTMEMRSPRMLPRMSAVGSRHKIFTSTINQQIETHQKVFSQNAAQSGVQFPQVRQASRNECLMESEINSMTRRHDTFCMMPRATTSGFANGLITTASTTTGELNDRLRPRYRPSIHRTRLVDGLQII